MSFYGSVINYIAKTFSKIKIGNSIIQAKRHDEQLELDSDSWIVLTPEIDNNKIIISHNTPQEVVDHCLLNINNNDISTINENSPNGAQITVQLPTFDEKGHSVGLEELSINININDEISRTQELRTEFDLEQKRASEEDLRLDKAIKEEVERAKETEKELSDRIGHPAEDDSIASGIYAYIDETKAAILGKGISDTFDTLVEIQDWINGPGVNATELTDAIAQETNKRIVEDELLLTTIRDNTLGLQAQITSNTERIDLLTDKADVEGSVAYAIAQEVSDRDKAIEKAVNDLQDIYETKSDANNKLVEANRYTDESIEALDVPSVYSNTGYYVSNISQENGKINPVWQALPFDTSTITAVYVEEIGNLTLPINLTIQ